MEQQAVTFVFKDSFNIPSLNHSTNAKKGWIKESYEATSMQAKQL